MSKKLFFLISFVLVLVLGNSVFAQPETWPAAYWSGFGDGSSWDDANNWWTVDAYWDDVNYATVPGRIWAKAPNAVPDADTVVHVGQGAPWDEYPAGLASAAIGYPVIDGETAVCYQIYISTGPNDTNGPGRLDVSGGTLTSRVYSDDWNGMMIGFVPDGNGVVNVSGGDILLDNYDGEGGLLAIGGWNYEDADAGSGVGTLNMTGGTVTCYHMDVPESDTPDPNAKGFINLHGGTFYTSADWEWTEFWMGDAGTYPDARIDVTEGKAIITSHDENELNEINGWIEEGKITAFGGINPRAELYRDYDVTNPGKTTLQAIATEPNQAWHPKPGPGMTVDYRPVKLSWTPGDNAVSHVVYISTDRDAVINGTAPNTPSAPNDIGAGSLEFDTPYFWRVDECNASGKPEWPGVTWDFKSADYVAPDDFDSYADTTALGAVWVTSNLPKNGAQLSVEPRSDFVRSGQSMKFEYRNYEYNRIGGVKYYVGSEAEASASALEAGTDWTTGGAKALVLYFYGDPCNGLDHDYSISVDQMYVALEDGSANSGIVKYDKKYTYDMNDIKEASWHEWNIDLQEPCLAGVDMNNVAKVYIGFGGQKTGQMEPGAGDVYPYHDIVWFDDIRLYRIRCVPKYGPATDLTSDCITDYQELDMLGADWLKSGYDLSSIAPSTDPNRLVRYTFDTEGGSGTIAHNSGSLGGDANGTLTTAPPPTMAVQWVTPGAPHPDAGAYAVNFQGNADAAVIMDCNLNDVVAGGFTTNTLTITAWIKRAGDQLEWTGLVFSTELVGDATYPEPEPHAGLALGDNADWTPEGDNPAQNHLAYHWDNCPDVNDATPDGFDEIWWWRSGLLVPDGEWTFCAVVVEPEQASLYMMPAGEALLKSVNIETHIPATFVDPFNIGRDARTLWGSRAFVGQIDDVQIYDYALSDREVLYVAAGPAGSTHVPVNSPVDFDISDDIDFFDYGFIANNWLDEVLWPPLF